MHGKNPKRPPVNSDGTTLDVQEIFPTLQGEGPNAGTPAIFIRLGGCNLACDFCDTEFESFGNMQITDIVAKVADISTEDTGKKLQELIVITGGEPLRQPIEQLCQKLIDNGFKVQIETNGTLYRSLPEAVEIICSPKNSGNGYGNIREDLLARVNAFKFIISESDKKYSTVPEVGQSKYNKEIYVQPMDEYDVEKNNANLALAEKLALERGYKLSIQMHKIWGLP